MKEDLPHAVTIAIRCDCIAMAVVIQKLSILKFCGIQDPGCSVDVLPLVQDPPPLNIPLINATQKKLMAHATIISTILWINIMQNFLVTRKSFLFNASAIVAINT